jgi:hypothetical protein
MLATGSQPDLVCPVLVCPVLRTPKKVWSKYLRFRKTSQHSQCNTCFKLQQDLRDGALETHDRMFAAQALRQHYRDAYLDRCIYWAMRYESRNQSDVLCIIIDSMDRSKFAWPRFPFGQRPKWLEGIVRPRFVVTAALAHGYCTCLFVADEKAGGGQNHALCLGSLAVRVSPPETCESLGFAQNLPSARFL